MRCLILYISCVFFSIMLISCNQSDKKETYIYEYYDYVSNKSLGYKDTLVLENTRDSIFKATCIKNGLYKSFSVEHRENFIKCYFADTTLVLYSDSDNLIHDGTVTDYKFDSPYLVDNASFDSKRTYIIDGRKYSVSQYSTHCLSSNAGFGYYTPDYGFLLYVIPEKYEYKKLIQISNSSPSKNKSMKKLLTAVLSDSTFSFIILDSLAKSPKFHIPHK